jgi:hypothetical protein
MRSRLKLSDVADVGAFLASDGARWITGANRIVLIWRNRVQTFPSLDVNHPSQCVIEV